LELDPGLANGRGGPLPLRVLAEFSHTVRKDGDDSNRASVQKCLEHLLSANPDPTADFFTALQSLPDWLSERSVVMPSVQVLLNEKISQRFPTMVLMSDFYFLVLIIVFYSWNVAESIRRRESESNPSKFAIGFVNLIPLYVGAGYFLAREVIQMISLISLKSFHIWVYDGSNWLNVIFIILILFWSIVMNTGNLELQPFRTGSAVTVIVLWLKVLAFLRNMLIDFAVFTGGVFYVMKRLVAFLTALIIILVAFSQMFVTVFQQTDYSEICTNTTLQDERIAEHDANLVKEFNDTIFTYPETNVTCPEESLTSDRPFCFYWSSFLLTFSMLLGEVDEEYFYDSMVATVLFVIFMFLVVILLANVLIAIVTDSYKVIQDQRAAIVFWTNRLDFVAEMDAIANGPWKQRIRQFFGHKDETESTGHVDVSFGREFWKRLMDLFEDDVEDSIVSVEFWAYTLLRVAAAVVIIPSWFALGIFSAGWLWPPQLREMIFTSTVSKHSSESEREDELRKTQVRMLQREVFELKEDLAQELTVDRIQVVQMKSSIAERRAEIANEMKHIKRIMTMLFDQQAAL
jgi:hypothetical protein